MKIMTLNTHSLVEKNYEQKLKQFVRVVWEERPDILALQEVSQSAGESALRQDSLSGLVPCPGFGGTFKKDNHAARLARMLSEAGIPYYWTWVPAKLGYEKYDEGLAVFSRYPILEADSFQISRCSDYHNWKTRRVLGIRIDGPDPEWFYTVHMGWWKDDEEPFEAQWKRLEDGLRAHISQGIRVWLLGDFNSPDNIRGQGYDLVKKSGWLDTYELAAQKDRGATVEEEIDGWREDEKEDAQSQDENGENQGGNGQGDVSSQKAKGMKAMRIDYIWCSRPAAVQSSQVVCDGRKYPKVSDHYGVMVQVQEED